MFPLRRLLAAALAAAAATSREASSGAAAFSAGTSCSPPLSRRPRTTEDSESFLLLPPQSAPPIASRDHGRGVVLRAAAKDDDDSSSSSDDAKRRRGRRRKEAEEKESDFRRALLAARLELERSSRKAASSAAAEAAGERREEREGIAADASSSSIRVGIAGAGAVACGTAAFLSDAGHDPMLWSPSGKSTADLVPAAAADGTNGCDGFDDDADGNSGQRCLLTSTGAIEATDLHVRVAPSVQTLVEENDAILIALPANGHRAVFDAIAPYVRSGQHVIISSQASLGAVYLRHLLVKRGLDDVPVTAWGTTAVLARREGGTTQKSSDVGRMKSDVNVLAVRKLIDTCTVPEQHTEDGLALCRELFGPDRFRPRNGLLAISLSNLNPQNHMGIALGNMSRMERGERWSQGQNVTPKIGRLLEKLDEERLDIARALDLDVRTIYEHFHLSFHVPIASISEMNRNMHERGNGGTGPDTADSRYVTEDVPYGLALTVALGELVGRPAVLHESGIRIFSAMYGQDFEAENDLLDALDLRGCGLEELKEAAKTGLLRGSGSGEVARVREKRTLTEA